MKDTNTVEKPDAKQQVRKGEEIDEVKLKSYLKSKDFLSASDDQWNVTQFTHGYSNLTYLIETRDKTFVLRRPPAGAVKRGHDMGREFNVQKGDISFFFKSTRNVYICRR